MFKCTYSKFTAIIIVIFFLCTSSCSNNNSYTDKRYKIMVDSVYEPIFLKPYLERIDFISSLRLIDSLYHTEKHKTIWLDKFYYYNTSWINNNLKNYQLGINYADTIINIIEHNKLQELVPYEYSLAYLSRGNGYLGLNNFAQAYQDFFKAKQIAEQHRDCVGRFYLIGNIAYILYQQKQYESAKSNYLEGSACIKTCPNLDISDEQQNLDDIALCYTKLNKLDSASYYYNLALKTIEKYRYTSSKDSNNCIIRYATCRGVVLGNKAKIYAQQNQLDSSEKLYKEAIYLNTTKGAEKKDAQLCEEQLARVQLKQKNFLGMKQSLDQLKEGLDTLQNVEATLGWLEMMAAYYQNTNNPQQEIKYYRGFVAMRDSINLVKNGYLETNITKELKDKEQQFEITVLQKDNHLSRVYLWVVAIACLLAAVIAFIVYRSFKKTKQLNEKVNLQKSALEKANKDKDRILNVVAHDLRNPIGAIANFLDIAQVKYEHSEEEEQILKTSQQAAVHSLTLINDLLEINQMQDGQLTLYPAIIDVRQLIEQSIEQLKYKAIAKQQTIRLQTNTGKYLIKADAEKLQRVITNLIDNAIKFSFLEKEIVVSFQEINNKIEIKIMDSGVGIPPHIIEQLFTASITVKRKGTNNEKSNGLGLSICKQIIEAHNGKILVESEEGKGTYFKVELPI